MLVIDGAEAGGQILRSSIAMSALTGLPTHIFNIRKKRPKPGLAPQHLNAVKAVAQMCDARVKGLELRSEEIEFVPGKIKAGSFKFDIGTAGSATLVAQAILPAAIHAPGKIGLTIIGGTDNLWAPTTTYFQYIFCDFLKKIGIKVFSETKRFGFYPKGGGIFEVEIEPAKKIKPLNLLDRGAMKKIDIWSVASNFLQRAKVAERQISGFKAALPKDVQVTRENCRYVDTYCLGSSCHSHAHFENSKLGATIIGERGKRAEQVGKECALELLKEIESGATVDYRAADQLMIYMALAGAGKIKTSEITSHVKTNAAVIEKFLPVKFEIKNKKIKVKKY